MDKKKDVDEKVAKRWRMRNLIEKEILPGFISNYTASGIESGECTHFNRNILAKEYLFSVAINANSATPESLVLVGMLWSNTALINHEIRPLAEQLQPQEDVIFRILDSSGEYLMGDTQTDIDFIGISGDFDSRFPPWTIDIIRSAPGESTASSFFKSYYFWTILTLLMVLTFGVILIIRTMVREREIMRIKSDFVSSVSHELKTTLTSIKALTERLIEGKVKNPAKMKQYFSVISQDTDKLTRLVKNILDFSKIEEGKKEYHFVESDVRAWLQETVENFRKERSHDQIVINTQFDEDVPSIMMDKDELSQCVNNLVDNALKYSPEKRVVDVHLSKDNETVCLQVKDYGIGIKPEEQDKIFDKFFQGSADIRQSIKGTGLGLTLVKHAVEAHGGHIQVESRPGEGSQFTIILPFVRKSE